jgi:hypothetical protein
MTIKYKLAFPAVLHSPPVFLPLHDRGVPYLSGSGSSARTAGGEQIGFTSSSTFSTSKTMPKTLLMQLS